jgi:hypothetical protein
MNVKPVPPPAWLVAGVEQDLAAMRESLDALIARVDHLTADGLSETEAGAHVAMTLLAHRPEQAALLGAVAVLRLSGQPCHQRRTG